MASKQSTRKTSKKHDGQSPEHSSSSSSSTKSGAGRKQSRDTSSQTTTDHEEIRQWAEARGGEPACVKGTGGSDDVGLIRIEFPDVPQSHDDKLQKISWDEFFEKFDDQGLALVYQDELAGGGKSNFNKLVKRETAKARAAAR